MSGSFSYGSSRSRNYIDPDQKRHLTNLWGNAGNLFHSRQAPGPAKWSNQGYYTPPGQRGGFLTPEQQARVSEMPTSVGYDPNVAGFDPAQIAAQDYAINQAQTFDEQAQPVRSAYEFALSSPINPFTEQLVQTAARPVIQHLQENILPSIRGNSQSAGGYSSRTGIAEGIAGRGAIDTIGDISTNLYGDAYNTGINTMMGALGMAPQMAGYNMLPADYLSMIGSQRQAQQQQVLDAPWMNVNRYRDVIGGPHNVGESRSKNYSSEGGISI